jgi:hypothetical protein
MPYVIGHEERLTRVQAVLEKIIAATQASRSDMKSHEKKSPILDMMIAF